MKHPKPDGTAGMLVEKIEQDPAHREANIEYLKAWTRKHREAGNLMHHAIFLDAVQYFDPAWEG